MELKITFFHKTTQHYYYNIDFYYLLELSKNKAEDDVKK